VDGIKTKHKARKRSGPHRQSALAIARRKARGGGDKDRSPSKMPGPTRPGRGELQSPQGQPLPLLGLLLLVLQLHDLLLQPLQLLQPELLQHLQVLLL